VVARAIVGRAGAISRGADMGDKSPKKTNAKKPSKTLKEKRAAKHDKGRTTRAFGDS
jgi:hypothetical protein